jgi:hypothetical protein
LSRRDSNASDLFVTGDLIVMARQSGGVFVFCVDLVAVLHGATPVVATISS